MLPKTTGWRTLPEVRVGPKPDIARSDCFYDSGYILSRGMESFGPRLTGASGKRQHTVCPVQVFRSRDFVKREEVMRQLWQLLLLFGLSVVGTAVWAQPNYLDYQLCQPKIENEQRIAACTRLLNSGQVPETYLVVVHVNRGTAYLNKGAWDKAIADYNDALRSNLTAVGPSQLSEIYYNRGKGFYGKGMLDRAIADFSVVIRLQPNDDWAYNDRAVAYALQGYYQEARQDFERQLDVAPTNEAAARNLDILNRLTKPPSPQLSLQDNAVNKIREFADGICQIPTTGSRSEISGEVNFSFSLLSKILDSMGIKLGGKSQQWQGPEQKDFVTIVVSGNECRLKAARLAAEMVK